MRTIAVLGLLLLSFAASGQARFSVEYVPADKSQFQVQWLDWYGKEMMDSVELVLRDTGTRKAIFSKEFATAKALNAAVMPVSPGSYSLAVSRKNYWRRGGGSKVISIRQKTRTVVSIQDSLGSLRFRYDNNPKRPVSEFSFTAKQRNTGDTQTTAGSCAESYGLIPANYHVVIGTLPEFQLNTDVDSRSITQIDIPEPGFLQITNQDAICEVELWSPLGKRFVKFHSLTVTGDPSRQRVRLLPGDYELHSGADVQRFKIMSNKDTELEVK